MANFIGFMLIFGAMYGFAELVYDFGKGVKWAVTLIRRHHDGR